MVANVVVVGSWVRDFARQFRNDLKQVGARYDADKLICTHNGEPLDVMLLHQLHNFFERGILGHGVGLKRHDLSTLRPLSWTKSDATAPGPRRIFSQRARFRWVPI